MKKIITLICMFLIISGCSEQTPIEYDDSKYKLNGIDSFSNIEYSIDTSWTKNESDSSIIYYPESNDSKQITIVVSSDVAIKDLTDEVLLDYINGYTKVVGKENVDYQRINVNGYDGAYYTLEATVDNNTVAMQTYILFINGELINITFSENDQISQNYFDCAFNISNSIKYTGVIIDEIIKDESENIENQNEDELDDENELDDAENKNAEVQDEIDDNNIDEETAEEETVGHFNSSGIPIVNAKLNDIMQICNKYGVKKINDDIDNGDGTVYRDLQKNTYGLATTIVYDKKTNEVVYVNVIPNTNDSHENQINYILEIAGVCATEDYKEEVVNWFKNNVGSEEKTTIDGIEYRIHNGSCDNYCASFGEGNWEKWILQ